MIEKKNFQVLTIDDEPAIRTSFRAYLNEFGYDVLEAENGKIGLDVFQKENPDLILVDLRMPEMDGLQVIAEVVKQSPETPIIIVSGTGHISDAIEALRLGAWDYLVKPIEDMNILHHAVKKGLERSRLLRENRDYQAHLEEEVEKRTADLAMAMDNLRLSEEKYRSIFENLQDVYFEVKRDGTVLEVSPSVAALSQYKPEEIIGKNIIDFYLNPDKRQGFLDALEEHRQVLDHELIYKDKDGTLLPCSINAKLRYDSRINEEKICGTLRDITERKQAEKELARLASAIENAAEEIIITNTEGVIEYVNPAFERITGYSRPEILGQHIQTTQNQASASDSFQKMWSTITSGEIWSGQIRSRKKDNTLLDEEATVSPIQDSDGQILGYVSIKRDVTEKRQLEAQLRQAQKLEAIGTLAGGIAHDFNNILSGIYGFTELALINVPVDAAQHSHLQQVLNGANRARELVKQILTFSRQREVKPQPVQLIHLLKEGLKLLSATLPATIQIIQKMKSARIVLADPTQVHQLLMNLCTNAAHAMQDNGGILTVELADIDLDEQFAAKHPDITSGQYVCLAISDTGHGMDNDTAEKIFDPFFTTKKEEEGTGLGLSVVHGIVKKYAGLITVDSQIGKGTSFQIFLPALEEQKDVSEKPQTSLPTGEEHILFVDDAKTVAELGKLLLESLGYKVTAETDPQKALEIFQKKPDLFDLVITDQIMPQISGDVLAQKFINIRPELPVILTSGHNEGLDKKGIKERGFLNFISKPFRREEIATIVRKVFDEKK